MDRGVVLLVGLVCVGAVTLEPRSPAAARVPAPAPMATPGPGSSPYDEVACRDAVWRAARRAVDVWCAGSAPMSRAYYHWSFAQTRRRACRDFHAAFARCRATIGPSYDEEGSPVVVVDLTGGGEATYWRAELTPNGRGFRVRAVDFEEDCTGP